MNAFIPIAAVPWQKRSMVAPPWREAGAVHGRLGMGEMGRSTETEAMPDMTALLRAVGERQDVEAFEALFRHFAPRVKAYMARLAGDSQLAEELMQETMIAVWNKADRFDPGKGAVSTWIFTIARNLRIDAFRREKRPEFDSDDPAFVPDEVAPADVAFEARQTSAQLHLAMATLPDEQVALLKLAFFEDNSHSAIASSLNMPLGTVKSRLRLAFARLRAALDLPGEAS